MDTARMRAIIGEALEEAPGMRLKGIFRKGVHTTVEFETWVIRLDWKGREIRFEIDSAGKTEAEIRQEILGKARASSL